MLIIYVNLQVNVFLKVNVTDKRFTVTCISLKNKIRTYLEFKFLEYISCAEQ